ncbi:glycosyl hydrolase family 8 [Flavobacterium ginsengisoli]|uniref:glycosyl hydrolase family 8 n=1 Tax=Flavobacterium ginsengisoli TaxID=871694 RepID=UPI00241502CA|nr:glycosyl hydrolase family 8 [Flavobacterium ginsengisoli]
MIEYKKLNIKISAFVMIFILTLPLSGLGQNKKKTAKTESERPQYRNLFKEAGYSQDEIDKKLAKAYFDIFEGPNKVYFEEGDSLGYVSDVKNKDARTEGMSYGMMVAVQLNKKEVFDRLWRWSVKYMQASRWT